MDRQTSAALDRWLTREPSYTEEPEVRFCECGTMLYDEPDRVKDLVEYNDCDGKLRVLEYEYDSHSVEVLGEEFEGKTYTVRYFSCGAWDLDRTDVVEGTPDHEPHRAVAMVTTRVDHVCPGCGKRHVEHEV